MQRNKALIPDRPIPSMSLAISVFTGSSLPIDQNDFMPHCENASLVEHLWPLAFRMTAVLVIKAFES
jgi:hypothetical protein